ncbi:DMT family transporter [Agrobacterium rosae]|uniref:DMT family transporter n=1 Tax=Agrobacterium rosae TaxID=1972867 RepID=A0AAE5RYU0_9HYPH|nr:DMT family transporter [Agrobacterium rosae]KAA3512343.1 DMT family transporter [Agrobacterium rosae]KAA3520209.1 DMT family transporter [Agrobacterium rosae]MCM2432030.1 DMT family transporter [Agrobacterium rosae]MDX8327780.1 DMT family transporter [Agrobacterium rosae]MQB48965.1 DMT family transporter [Agrobacterium rosae]
MIVWIAMAFTGGVFVALSRQVNGRLSLSNSPLIASFWNHIVGFIVLTALGLIIGGLLPAGAAEAPWYAFIGGPIGVIFIASGSWLVPRIGAVNTALLVISGQMVSGVMLDLFSDQPPKAWASALGVLLILAGMVLTQRKK